MYRSFGWTLRRVLLCDETREALRGATGTDKELSGAPVMQDIFDALWIARQIADGREAWELRLVNPTPYALFETFEPDEAEEDREDVRREMEARLRERVSGEVMNGTEDRPAEH